MLLDILSEPLAVLIYASFIMALPLQQPFLIHRSWSEKFSKDFFPRTLRIYIARLNYAFSTVAEIGPGETSPSFQA